MPRKSKHGGVTWVAVKDRDDHKVRCRACSSIMFPREWWTHKCPDTEELGNQSKPSSPNSSNTEGSGQGRQS